MKRKVVHPPQRDLNGPKYWRSLDELAATPGFQEQLEREFPQGAAEMNGVDRRHFMKIMAASFALGGIGLAGCRRPEKFILPYGKSVEGVIPGLPQYYATSMPIRGSAIPLLAETHQGRPTKIEGNPSYAPHGGASSLHAQASILDLYDPDRATAHTKAGAVIDAAAVNALLADISKSAAADGGASLAFLAESSSSPTRARLVKALRAKFPKAIWSEFDAVTDEAPFAAAQASFGASVKPLYQFAKAKRIVSLDCDFLSAEAGSLYYTREFTKGRKVTKPEDPMNRLYVAESNLTLTGSMADHRLRLPSSKMLALAAALAVKVNSSFQILAALTDGLDFKDKDKWLTEVAADLADHRGESLVVAGAHQPASVHAIAFAINAFLGNLGKTLELVDTEAPSAASITDLATALKAGSVKTLVILGGNPAYNAPADLDFAAAIGKAGQVVRLGYHSDETSAVSGVNLASAHYLESWGDARTVDGTIVPVQPMILPLFGGLTEIEVIARIAGIANPDSYALVHETHAAGLSADAAEKKFRRFLHDGYLEGSAYPKHANPRYNPQGTNPLFAKLPSSVVPTAESLEVRFATDHKMDDGRYLNNGWLQECPDAITKLAWDNVILVSPVLGKKLGIDPKGSMLQVARKEEAEFDAGQEKAHLGEITLNGRKIVGPIHIQPGLDNYTVVVQLGYGRTKVGRVGTESGYNAYPIRTSDALHFAVGATLKVVDGYQKIANVQEHWSMEGRDIVRESNYEGEEGYKAKPGFVKEMGLEAHSPSILGEYGEAMSPGDRATQIPRGGSLYSTPKFDGLHQWGMSIDLNTCIGCNACVVACQAENNIPIVGREQVKRGREMHWIRLDRYYSSGTADAEAFGGEGNKQLPEDPQVSLQPVACMQCELAPCETVCPVNATVHDEEGLNTMAYNRCIGTRYCANNCPYKVRRFNFFDWNQRSIDSLYMGPVGPHGMPELVKMVKNPDVTVRMRGVMEKCTYCVQRIEQGKIQHKVKTAQAGNPSDVVVPDGTIKTACQQVCPAEAIVFGNILDKDSAVSVAKTREQNYELLGYLNIRPRTTYSGKLRNPNPKMPDYGALPLSRVENLKKNGTGHEGAHHGAGEHAAPAHEEKKAEGHGVIDAMKKFGGLS